MSLQLLLSYSTFAACRMRNAFMCLNYSSSSVFYLCLHRRLISSKVGRINIAGFCTLMAGIFCLAIWVSTKSYGVLVFFAIIGGTCAGTFWTTIGPVGAEVVGLKELPSALSLTWLVLVLPTTCKFQNIQNLYSASRANRRSF